MKVLFLDCDGVLNDTRDSEVICVTGNSLMLNYRKIGRLLKIIEDTGCKIVLSSSWRKLHAGIPYLQSNGIPIYDKTGNSARGIRGLEIKDWLSTHPEVTEYAIVDDDSDILDEQLRHFVQTDRSVGLTEEAAYRITYILNNGARSY